MQFQKKTSFSKSFVLVKFLIKCLIVLFVLFLSIVLIDKIEFPYPNKQIEKIIPNENLKVVK